MNKLDTPMYIFNKAKNECLVQSLFKKNIEYVILPTLTFLVYRESREENSICHSTKWKKNIYSIYIKKKNQGVLISKPWKKPT